MQYGVKIDNYKRAKDSENVKNNMKIEASSIGLIMAMVAGLLISRVHSRYDFWSSSSISSIWISIFNCNNKL